MRGVSAPGQFKLSTYSAHVNLPVRLSQMISYETQLAMKKEIVRKAFLNFSGK
jgi:hypothetical protein